nr:MAG TPA: Cytosine specific methyltransferase [Caudoviricetes sp.]
MNRPKLLDLFCCEGGAATGYERAGFDVVGIDIHPQPLYPFEFHQSDAIDYVRAHGHEFDAIHASPPCQAHSTITPDKSKHVDLIPATRTALIATGKPYVIENVEGAARALIDPVRLCGSSFGLRVRRHRYFESNVYLWSMPCMHEAQGTPTGVYGDHADGVTRRPDGTSRGVKAQTVDEARAAMGMPWASWHGTTQAIPPAYTEFIGRQLLAHLEVPS